MRKVFFLVTVFILCFFCFNIPAAAADLDSDLPYIDLVDYGFIAGPGANGSSNFFYYSNSATYTFPNPYPNSTVGYVDIVLYSGGGNAPSSVISNWGGITDNNLTIEQSGKYIRIYGSIRHTNYQFFTLKFSNTYSDTIYLNLVSFKIYSTQSNNNVFDSYTYFNINGGEFTVQSNAQTASLILPPSTSVNYADDFRSYLYFYDWRKYDYMEVYFMVESAYINSIVCTAGAMKVPCEFNIYLNNGTNWILVDLNESYQNEFAYSSIYYIQLKINTSDLDRSVTQTPYVTISGIYDTSYGVGVQVYSTRGIVEAGWPNMLFFYFQQLKGWLSSGFASVVTKLDNLVNVGSGAADEFGSTVGDQTDEFNDLSNEFNSVTKPAVEDINTSIDSVVSPNDIFLATSPLTFIFEGNIFYSIIFMSLILALCSYVLFGKR